MDALSNMAAAKATMARQRAAAQADTQAVSRAGSQADREAAVERKAEKLESVFLSNMLQPMFKGMKTDGMFGGGHGEKMFRQELIQEYADKLAKSSDLGLADQIKTELIKQQEVG